MTAASTLRTINAYDFSCHSVVLNTWNNFPEPAAQGEILRMLHNGASVTFPSSSFTSVLCELTQQMEPTVLNSILHPLSRPRAHGSLHLQCQQCLFSPFSTCQNPSYSSRWLQKWSLQGGLPEAPSYPLIINIFLHNGRS